MIRASVLPDSLHMNQVVKKRNDRFMVQIVTEPFIVTFLRSVVMARKNLAAALTEQLGASVLPDANRTNQGIKSRDDRFMVQIATEPPIFLSFTVKDREGNYRDELTFQGQLNGRTVERPQPCWIQRWSEELQEMVPLASVNLISNKYGALDTMKEQYLEWKKAHDTAESDVEDTSSVEFGPEI